VDVEKEIADLRARLARLEDESAIRRLMADMMRKADDRDFPRYGERMVEYYTDDGQWTSGAGFANVGMSERGRAALTKKFLAGTRICESSHLLGTESIEVDGDSANGSWLCFEPATLKGKGDRREAVWIMGRYACEFRRNDAGWKLRTVRYDGIFCTPYAKGWTAERFVSIHPEAASAGKDR
jgi:ketosteroid isomerase-like protein